jgi:hypothetical protein
MSSHPFNLQAVACKVYAILTENLSARDDDKLLLVEIWSKESKSLDMNGFFKELVEGNLSHPESIRRMRQKIQEKHPNLRGEKWDVRHNMEGAICQQLTFFDIW